MELNQNKRIVNDLINNVYETVAKNAAEQPVRDYLGMSEIGHSCPRKLWLSLNHKPESLPLEGRVARLFQFGRDREMIIISNLQAAGYKVDSQQLAFSDFEGRFQGHCDGIIHKVTKNPHILEIKTANEASFKAFVGKGVKDWKPTYWAQMQCYMGYSGLTRALIIVENKNTQELAGERIYFDESAYLYYRERARRIIKAKEAPPLKFKASDFECRFCDFRINCHHNDMFK